MGDGDSVSTSLELECSHVRELAVADVAQFGVADARRTSLICGWALFRWQQLNFGARIIAKQERM